nr:endoplasmic reticulum metallopeptidase 1 isoform X1 [Ipomoea batatas]
MAERSGYEILVLLAFVICGTWGVFHYQFKVLPEALSPEDAGVTGFSEEAAMAHDKALSSLGPHPLGSAVLDTALEYVLKAATTIQEEAYGDVNVEVECFHANTGVNTLSGGSYYGKTLVYSDMKHVLIRISSKSAATKLRSGEEDNAILVSAHVDTVFAAEGAGDDTSNVAVMLELARGLSKQASGFKNSVIFLFNTGEEEGLNGAHSFVTQHPWINTVRVAVDLEAIGLGGKSGIFQAGPDPWAIQNFAKVAKRPSGQIVSQDLFASGVIKSSTDFQVYKEVAGLSGLDFAFTDSTAVYHTKNDKVDLLKVGSLQHLGDNMLPFLLHAATSSDFPTGMNTLSQGNSEEEVVDTVVYFDILGKFMVVYPQSLADMINTLVIALALLVWSALLNQGGLSSLVSLALSVLSIVLMWICSLGLTVLVAYIIPSISASPVPFIASPWLVIGLFAAPALLGAFVGQHVVYLVLRKFLSYTFSETKGFLPLSLGGDEEDVAVLDSEKWMFKAGLLQWLLVLAVGNYLNVGSSYFALFWMISPAVAYFLFEVLAESTKPLNPLTAVIGLAAPLVVSSGVFVQLVNTLIGNLVRFASNPGAQADWIATAIVAALIAAVVCLTMVYVLPYIHNSGAKHKFIMTTSIVLLVSLGMVEQSMVPPFIDDTARAVNIVQVVNNTGEGTVSHISLFSTTPGGLVVEAEKLGGGLVCGREKSFDFVTFTAYYSCWTAETEWSNNALIPALRLGSDSQENDDRSTLVHISTGDSTRWCLSINTNEIQDFQLKDESGVLVSRGEKNSIDGWHLMQFAGGKNSPTKFDLTLHWHKNSYGKRVVEGSEGGEDVLLKLRADVNATTPELDKILEKMPSWISQYGKSTSPFTLAYFDTMYVADSLTMGISVASE